MSEKIKRVHLVLPYTLYNEVKEYAGELGVSNFLRNSAQEKLKVEKESANEFSKMAKKIDAIDGDFIRQKLDDLDLRTHLILEDILKQNELLKLIFRRLTITNLYTEKTMDHLKSNEEFKRKQYEIALAIFEKDLEKINFN